MSKSPIRLPQMLVFDHSSLQDFVECPRRFYLRYVDQLHFPAPESSPLREFEAQVELDAQFHQLVRQHLLGIPAKALAATIHDEMLEDWWKAYLKYGLVGLPERRTAETVLNAPLAGRRLVAKYDLLALDEDRAVIAEWKTGVNRPTREGLQSRLQTAVYPYLLAKAGAHLNGGNAIAPETITMIYWYAEAPEQQEVFVYSAEQCAEDEARLEGLAADILRRGADEFELTDNLELCQFCAYRSLNDRGTKAGNLLATDLDTAHGDTDHSLLFDQAAEAGI